jgi:uncharacterized protein
MVAAAALFLGKMLNGNGVRLNLQLLEAAALLHDIAKARSLETGENHSLLGGKILRDLGLQLLAPIVEDHATLDEAMLLGPVDESLLVNYSDKRVKHDRIVTIRERFDDLMQRYAKTENHLKYLRDKFVLYQELEERIFEHLNVTPNGREVMDLSLDNNGSGTASEHHEH